jgi:hypothetical protein
VDAAMILRKYPELDWDTFVSEAKNLQLSFVALAEREWPPHTLSLPYDARRLAPRGRWAAI